jgi:hypothetical protein
MILQQYLCQAPPALVVVFRLLLAQCTRLYTPCTLQCTPLLNARVFFVRGAQSTFYPGGLQGLEKLRELPKKVNIINSCKNCSQNCAGWDQQKRADMRRGVPNLYKVEMRCAGVAWKKLGKQSEANEEMHQSSKTNKILLRKSGVSMSK